MVDSIVESTELVSHAIIVLSAAGTCTCVHLCHTYCNTTIVTKCSGNTISLVEIKHKLRKLLGRFKIMFKNST